MTIMNAGTEGSGSGEAAGEGSDVGETKKTRTCAQSVRTTKIKNRLQHSDNKTNRSITVEFKGGGKIQGKGKARALLLDGTYTSNAGKELTYSFVLDQVFWVALRVVVDDKLSELVGLLQS